MRKLLPVLFFSFVVLLLASCSKNDEMVQNDGYCDKAVTIDQKSYDTIVTNNYKIRSAVVSGDCLEIIFNASGCDSKNWKTALVDAGTLTNSIPPHRNIKFVLTNGEACNAYFTDFASFDISPLKVAGENKVIIHLAGFEDPIEYTY